MEYDAVFGELQLFVGEEGRFCGEKRSYVGEKSNFCGWIKHAFPSWKRTNLPFLLG
ncbi:hypothetical protein [Sphingobacterium phlebotomi]|uniref:hypothetical protein n=1 Tax=Sphingobacterium phlebotomi TaxID=2605433 RepID=UPI0016534F29|nr:hypothetical protein [Sphingobacterium phlebotomi]